MTHYGNPALEVAQQTTPVAVIADPAACSFQFNPVNTATFTSSCDIAKSYLANQMISYVNTPAPAGAVAAVTIGETRIAAFDGTGLPAAEFHHRERAFQAAVAAALNASHYPLTAAPAAINHAALLGLATWLLILYAWVFGSIPSWMCELFPARVRFTAMSFPYNLGNGLFGGFMPATAFAMVAANGNIYFGLWYTIVVTFVGAVLCLVLLPETSGRTLEEVDGARLQPVDAV